MDKADLQAALQAAELSQLAQAIDTITQPSIRLLTTPISDDELSVGTSKIGGLPDLPADLSWPNWKGKPQSFIAQLRLDELHAHDETGLLPAQGMLWFFYDAKQKICGESLKERDGWQIYYRANPAQLQRARAPWRLSGQAKFQASTITMSPELTLALQPELEAPELALDDEQQERYDTIVEQFTAPQKEAGPLHRVLGFPDTLQDDMRLQCQLATHNISLDYEDDDPHVAELEKDQREWQLLFQVDTDERIGMRWASTGMLYYWLRRPDVQASKFDDSWLVLQSE